MAERGPREVARATPFDAVPPTMPAVPPVPTTLPTMPPAQAAVPHVRLTRDRGRPRQHRRLRRLVVIGVLSLGLPAGCTSVGGHPTIALSLSPSPSGRTTTTDAPADRPGGAAATGTASSTSVRGSDVPAGSDTVDLPTLPDVTSPTWQPTTRSEELTATLAKDGPSVQEAVDAASLVTAVPGATSSNLPAGAGLGPDATMALISRYYSLMAPDQQQAVTGLLATTSAGVRIGADGQVTKIGHGLGRSAALATPSDGPMGHLTDLAGLAAKDLRATAPTLTAHGTVELFQATNAYGTWALSGFPDPYDPTVWDIIAYPPALDGSVGDAVLKLDLVKVLFEASEFRWNPKYVDEPVWLTEGAAYFAAYDTYRTVPGLPQPDADWFDMRDEPLAYRTTDAWPLFASLHDAGGDPYTAAFDMVNSGRSSVRDLLAAAGIDGDGFASFRASQTFRHDGSPLPLILGWPRPDEAGPTDNADTTGAYPIGEFTVTDGGDYTHVLRNMTFTPDVGLVTFTAGAEVLTTAVDGQPVTISPGSSATFCIASGGCTCPSGRQPGFQLTDATPPLLASLPELPEQNSFQVQDRKWEPDSYCGDTPTPPRLVGASAVADPHLTTFDGSRYDLMDLGEFVAVRDPRGGLEVQDRTQPYDHATSGITAVAIGTGDHRITVTTGGIDDSTWVVRLDGAVITADAFRAGDVAVTIDEDAGSDRTVASAGRTLTAVWPDGSTVAVTGCCGMWLNVKLPPQRAARVVGLLGDGDGNTADDLRRPDGTWLGAPSEAFAATWYVTDGTSLFDYDAGKNTESYRGPLPPEPAEPTSDQRRQCAESLGAKANGADLQNCAYDVAGTGDADVVQSYLAAATVRAQSDTSMPVTTTSAAGPTASSAPVPTGVATAPGPQAGDTPWLTLSGTVVSANSVPYGTPAPAPVTGSIRLPKDTVLVIKAARCLASADVQVTVALHGNPEDSPPSTSVYACDPQHFESADADQNATVTDGEVYVMITTAGVYDLTVFTFAAQEFAVSVAFYADPTPTLVSTQDFQGKGYTGTLSGIGDTVVATVRTDGGQSWALTGAGSLCRAFNYAFTLGDPGPTSIGADCWHNPDPSVGIGPTSGTPYLIFSRDTGSQQISLVPQH